MNEEPSPRHDFAVCIPTHRRPQLLVRLLGDLRKQSVQPNLLIVVDGDPESDDVRRALEHFKTEWRTIYAPSNHANLPYQRYLGWKLAAGRRLLLYLDDDLIIPECETVEKILAPLTWADRKVAGVTAKILMGKASALRIYGELTDRKGKTSNWEYCLVRRFGSGRKTPPGGLTPVGDRRMPESDEQYARLDWLSGGVMAYRMDALTQECFSDVLFAMAATGCGLGEDTFLSRRASANGELLLANCAIVQHPHDDAPKCYPTDARRYGHAVAYSRRFLNDNYRVLDRPSIADRWALLKSYLGNTALNWVRALAEPRNYRWAYALGYTHGALRGLLRQPSAASLTPGIDWWVDAERAVAGAREMQGAIRF
ncbi:MAG: glycosyltransferase [Acidobacteriales bacterium]|nr:glycosyltransferase [Terriglobales bacterium]